MAALANGCAHRVLAERAKELGTPHFLTTADISTAESPLIINAVTRLNGHGDVEEGGQGGHQLTDYPLQFFRVESGTRVNLRRRVSSRDYFVRTFAVLALGCGLALLLLLDM